MSEPYTPPQSEILASRQDENNFVYLGFWARVLASILDNIWIGIVLVILLVGLGQAGVIQLSMTETGGTEMVIQTLIPLIMVVALWIKYASTPGKMAFGAKILDANTFGEVPAGRLVLRYVAYFVSVVPVGLGFLWVAIDKRKQGWHDKIAGTVVVKDKR